MCATCGCDHDEDIQILRPGDSLKKHFNDQATHSREVQLEIDVLHHNNLMAERNRGYFEAKNIFVVNLVSSPGSGKTSLLEQTALLLKDRPLCIIEGDQQTSRDADRIYQTGVPVVQINTGHGCHLDADMVHKAIHELNPANDSILIIENVGNLVCPALFDLGETHRVVMMSVTEGEDKPIKYPDMFASSQLCLINKTDLLPYVDFRIEKAKEYALRVNPKMNFMETSVTKNEGLDSWLKWLHHDNHHHHH